jgi:hypothetical protein
MVVLVVVPQMVVPQDKVLLGRVLMVERQLEPFQLVVVVVLVRLVQTAVVLLLEEKAETA